MTSKLNEMKYAAVMGAFINTTVYNNTVNNSTYDIPEKHQSVLSMYQTEQLILLWFLFAFVVIGNAIVLVSVCLVRHKKSRMNFFIMNLAIADLSVGLLNILPDIIHRYTREFYGGEIVCKLVKYVQAIVVYGSTYQLVALSIDRYDAIVHPMNFSGSDKRSMIMVISMWVVAFILAVPSPVFFEETVLENGEVQCWIELPQTNAIANTESWLKDTGDEPVIEEVTPPGYSYGHFPREKSAGSGIAFIYKPSVVVSNWKPLINVVSFEAVAIELRYYAFIVCWSPFTLWFILEIYGHIPKNDLTMTIHIIVQNLPSLNSATNPAIYGLFSTNICKELRRIPALNWIAAKLPCCEEWSPRPRSTTYRDTNYTDVSMTEPPIPMKVKDDTNSKELIEGVYTSL
uniref:Cardioacceleratory peptide receptor-like n=1 Tax=Saccoglossus kowalevskii TaxID=10224 RepID=A0ABM0M1C1_SACKO|nr:PREDICTED: cardioacceleratory peptide receptor-like [Saccoglossus kowalevskii]